MGNLDCESLKAQVTLQNFTDMRGEKAEVLASYVGSNQDHILIHYVYKLCK